MAWTLILNQADSGFLCFRLFSRENRFPLFPDKPWRQPMVMRLALPPAAAVLIDIDTSSSSQLRQ